MHTRLLQPLVHDGTVAVEGGLAELAVFGDRVGVGEG